MLLKLFDVLFYLFVVFFVFVIVEDVPYEFDQEQLFEEEEHLFLGEEGKWFFSPAYSIFVLYIAS